MGNLTKLGFLLVLVDGTFLHSFLQELSAAGFPTTAPQMGGVLAWALVALWLRLKKSRADARRMRAEVQAAVAGHLATLNDSTSADTVPTPQPG